MLAPFTTMSGACSPPIASSAMTTRLLKAASRRLGRCRNHLAPVVIAAGGAEVMRPPQLAAIRAFDVSGWLQRVVRTPHVAARLGGLFLRNGHGMISGCWPRRGWPQLGSENRAFPQPRSPNPWNYSSFPRPPGPGRATEPCAKRPEPGRRRLGRGGTGRAPAKAAGPPPRRYR